MNHILNYSKKVFNKIDELWRNETLMMYLLSAMLITLPMKHIIGSLTCIVFLVISFVKSRKATFSIPRAFLLPMLLYVLMILSLIWTIESKQTIKGLQKEVLFLVIPLAFCGWPKMNQSQVNQVLKYFSFAMVVYAIFYFLKAIIKFSYSKNIEVFFYHELVTLQLNAIYVSVFASMAWFFFLVKRNKSKIDKTGFLILAIFIFLLSSKNIIVVDLILIMMYYLFFSSFSKKIKTTTILIILMVTSFSVFFIAPVRDRFMMEFDTAFVDNSVNKTDQTIKNISIKQAWNDNKFEFNNFFTGTSLRIFQIRIFKEMLHEENIFFTGFGLDASQEKIKQKVKEHNLHPSYGDFNFHNEYIQIFSELGIFGLLIIVSMLFITIRKGIINKDFIHIAFSVTMIVLFLTESFLSRQRGIIFFIILYCMFNVANNSNEQTI